MENGKTSLSAGLAVYAMLTEDEKVAAMATKVFPVVTDKAELPYIAYRRAAFDQNPVKAGMPGADTVRMEVACYAANYAQGVEMAEAARKALEGGARTVGGLRIRSCMLTDAAEEWQDDAYVQRLVFDLRL